MTSGGYILFNANYGPYGTRYPSIVNNTNNALMNGLRPSPAIFSNTGNVYSSARQSYMRTLPICKNVMSSGERIHLQKIASIGRSSLKQGLPLDAYISNKSCDKSFVATKLQRVRSSGCVAPKKCGSIY